MIILAWIMVGAGVWALICGAVNLCFARWRYDACTLQAANPTPTDTELLLWKERLLQAKREQELGWGCLIVGGLSCITGGVLLWFWW